MDDTIIKKLSDYQRNPENEKVQSYFTKDNIWNILDIQRYEPSHSAFLAWFFSQKEAQYSQIKALLLLLIEKAEASILSNNWNLTPDMEYFYKSILTGSYLIKTVWVVINGKGAY